MWPIVRSIPQEHGSFTELNRQTAGPVAVSYAGRTFARLAHQYLAKDDLTAARNAALAAWAGADIPDPRKGKTSDVLMDTYLFPEGDALRFFTWDMEYRINYVEIRGDMVALVWAADLVGDDRLLPDGRTVPWPSNLMPRVPYKFDAGSAMTREYEEGWGCSERMFRDVVDRRFTFARPRYLPSFGFPRRPNHFD